MESGFSTQMVEIIFSTDLSCAKFLKFVDFIAPDGTHYRIPAFQPTDFGSIPKLLWGPPLYLIPTGWWTIPCAGHDAAFQNTLQIVNADGSIKLASLTEAQANTLLKEMMQAIKPYPNAFELTQMNAIYEGVKWGGASAFAADRA